MQPKRSLLSLLPVAITAVSLGIMFWLWTHEQQATQRALKADFDFSVRQTASRIEARLASYEQLLRGMQGLFHASDQVDRARFDTYVDALLAGADFAGIESLAYAPLPPGSAALSAPVAYVAPATSLNLKALGDDPYADPLRRVGLLQARDSGGIGIAARLAAPTDAAQAGQAGFQMYLPVYGRGQALDSVAARRAALAGWVIASVRMGDLMSSLYGEGMPGIAVQVHDGVAIKPETLMYQSATDLADARRPRFEAQEYIGFADHTWTLGVIGRPEFEQRYSGDATQIIAIAGSVLSLLLGMLTYLLVSGRARAHNLASAMTRQLRASEEGYRRIVDTADEGIWMTDAQSRTSFVNPKMAQLLGCSAADLLGRPLADFSAAGGPPPAPDSAGLAPGVAERHELQFRRRDGSLMWASMATSPIFDAAGRRTGALSMVTDITDRKHADAARTRLEAQLRESQKMQAIGTLAGGIAHDFNNILAAILGNVALAQQQAGLDPAARRNLEQITTSAVRARSLVQQILAFSRRQPQRLVRQPLRPLVEEAVRLLRPILPALVELEVALADAPLTVEADATQLQQVVMNLCTNAWHALQGQAGRVTVGLDAVVIDTEAAQRLGELQPGGFAHLWVSDSGCGMDEATRLRVFEPFFTTKPVGQGTGLGLSVVHGIVATHHGAITVASAPGQGSRFDVYLPLLAAAAVVASTAAAEPAPAHNAGRHVAYVDDDPVMLLMVQGLLQRSGYRVTCFDDPRDALVALRAQPEAYDLVLTDYNMPGLSGLDIAREVAAIRPGLAVVISSGYVADELLAAAAQAGVRRVMPKEYTLEQLPDLIHQVLTEPAQA